MISIHVDWQDYYNKGWENIGRNLIESNCKHKETKYQSDYNMRYSGYCEKCGFSEDSCEPMMNYAYPLELTPEDNKIIEVCKKTNLTVMYNTEKDKYYLVLTGGGMDLSQDIALAYNIIEKWIPLELALNVSTQDELRVSGKEFRKVMRACKKSIKKDIGYGKIQIKKIKEAIKNSLTRS